MTTQQHIKILIVMRNEYPKNSDLYKSYTNVLLDLLDEIEDEEYQTYAELVLDQKYTEPIKKTRKIKHIHCPCACAWDCPYYTSEEHPCRCTLENPAEHCNDFLWHCNEDGTDYIDDDWEVEE